MAKNNQLTRRKFISNAAVIGAAGALSTKDLFSFFNTPAPFAKDTFWFISATHWEGAVFKTREQYLEMGLPNILTALKLLNDYPGYRFTLDQVCYVKPFLERYPEEAESFRQFVKDGRLQIVGGTDCMNDANIPTGESMVRQIALRENLFQGETGGRCKSGMGA